MAKLYESLTDIEIAPTSDRHLVKGIPLYERTFDHVLQFHPPGVAPVKDSTGAFHINTKGEDLYSHRFKKTFGFYEGFAAAVQSSEGAFHITLLGTLLYKEKYKWCGNFQEGLCPVQDKSGAYFHINALGKRPYEQVYAYVGDFKEGIAVVHTDKGATHIDRQGSFLHGQWLLDLDIFHKGFARARDSEGWYHVSKGGIPLYKDRYRELEPFYNGIARALDFQRRPLLLNEQGHVTKYLWEEENSSNTRSVRPEWEIVSQHKLPEEALPQKALQALSGDLVGFWALEVIKQAINIGLLDLLPAPLSTLSRLVKVPEEVLQRFLRALDEIKVVEKREAQEQSPFYQLTSKGALLCPADKAPMAAAALMWSDSQKQWGNLDLLKCSPHRHLTFKEKCWDKKQVALYQRSIDGYAQNDFCGIDQVINWRTHHQLLGLGRVSSVCLKTILHAYPHLHAHYYYEDVLMNEVDIPLSLKACFSKVKLDILNKEWPSHKFDAILLPRFMHYFPNTDAQILLEKVKKSLINQGKIYLFEMLLSEDSPEGGLLDINMLAESGGLLRTITQWEKLLSTLNVKITSVREIHPHLHLLVGESYD